MKLSPWTLAVMLKVPALALGTVEFVRTGAAVIYMYSAAGTADLEVLERSPNYLGTDLDVWCWYGKHPPPEGVRPPATTWRLREGLDHDLERHEFRLPDEYWKLYSAATQAMIKTFSDVIKKTADDAAAAIAAKGLDQGGLFPGLSIEGKTP